jgi:hypothetical protein
MYLFEAKSRRNLMMRKRHDEWLSKISGTRSQNKTTFENFRFSNSTLCYMPLDYAHTLQLLLFVSYTHPACALPATELIGAVDSPVNSRNIWIAVDGVPKRIHRATPLRTLRQQVYNCTPLWNPISRCAIKQLNGDTIRQLCTTSIKA